MKGEVDRIRAQMELVFWLVGWVGIVMVERRKKKEKDKNYKQVNK